MDADTPVVVTSTLIALCLLPLDWLVTAGLILMAGLIGCGCVAFAVRWGRPLAIVKEWKPKKG